MNIAWLIGLASSSILFFFAYLFLSMNNYKQRFKDVYDLRNHFPYEFNYQSRFADNVLGNIALILCGSFSLGLFACSLVYRVNNGMLLFALISGSLYTILFVLLDFIPLKYMKLHMVFSILLFVAAFFTPSAIGLTALREYQDSKNVITLILFIACIVVGVFNFALAMNPRLSLNIKMQVATDEKGNEYYVRPKFIMMAFTEWLMISSLFVSQILLVLILSIL